MSLFEKMVIWSLPLVPKPIVGYFSKNYIAGSTLDEAIRVIKDLNAKGMMATMDLLGEEVTEKEQSLDATEQYIKMLEEIENHKLDSNVSLKPTHLGLELDQEFCFENIKRIVVKARELNNFVRIDMEDHTTTDATISMYLKLKEEFGKHVGTVLQSYLHRTDNDVDNLVREKANLRLCKGIYVEPERIAFKNMSEINNCYNRNLDKLLEANCYLGIATHDEKLINHALETIERLKLDKNKYEFQMLLGVRENLRDELVQKGHRLRVYVPYGKEWYQYSTRRLKENPRMAGMVVQKIFGFQ
jgi:proline dehydrogenase